jgi:hypothetical protein
MPLAIGRYYGAFAGNTPLLPGDFLLKSSQDFITATAGGGQPNAFPLNAQISRVTVVATAGDSVMLPPSSAGIDCWLINKSANAMQVFGNGSDTINDQAAATGVSQAPNSAAVYACGGSSKWYTQGLATGFAGAPGVGAQTFPYSSIVAGSGNSQAAGTPITTQIVAVTSGSGSYSVTLPPSAPGLEIVLLNNTGNSILVWPNAGGTGTERINVLAANTQMSFGSFFSAIFTCVVAGQWWTVPRTPS